MARSAIAAGPIPFLSVSVPTLGEQIFIPLDAITIDASGVVHVADAAVPSGFQKSAIEARIQYLYSIGVVTAAPAAAQIGLSLQAAVVGAGGNNIAVQIAYPDSTQPTYTATIRESQSFPVGAADVVSTINGFAGGLVQAAASAGYTPPYAQTLTASTGELTSGSELVLATAQAGIDAVLTTIAVDPTPTLTVTWQKTITVTPPSSLPPPAGQQTQKQQIDAALAYVSITSSDDVAASSVVAVPTGPTSETAFASNKLDLPGASGTALTLTIGSAPSSSDTNLNFTSTVTAKVTPLATGYQLTIKRVDVYGGADLKPDTLGAVVGTTGDSHTAATPGSVTGGLVVLRTNGATPSPFVAVATTPLVVRAADGRYEAGLKPGSGLSFTPAISAIANKGTWSVTTSAPDSAGNYTVDVSWTNSGSVDTTKTNAEQVTAWGDIAGGLVTATPKPATGPALVPQAGVYSLQGGGPGAKASLDVPARS